MKDIIRIKIIAVGKIRPGYLKEGIADFKRRLKFYAKLEIAEVKDEGCPSENIRPERKNMILRREAASIRELLPAASYVIALDRKGQRLDSKELAARLGAIAAGGQSNITFLVGGSLGLEPALIKEADLSLSFSLLTFPHQLFRLLLLEQLYRVFTILNRHPYHK